MGSIFFLLLFHISSIFAASSADAPGPLPELTPSEQTVDIFKAVLWTPRLNHIMSLYDYLHNQTFENLTRCFDINRSAGYLLGDIREECETVADEIDPMSFKVTEANFPMALDLRAIHKETKIIVEFNLFSLMNISILIQNRTRLGNPKDNMKFPYRNYETLRVQNVSEYFYSFMKEDKNERLVIVIEGKGIKTVSIFEISKKTHAEPIFIFLIILLFLTLLLTANLLCHLRNQNSNLFYRPLIRTAAAEIRRVRLEPKLTHQIFQLTVEEAVSSTTEIANTELQEQNEECSICMCKFQNAQVVIVTLCAHLFHYDCFAKWYNMRKQCPYCRREQSPFSGDFQKRKMQVRLIEQGLLKEGHQEHQFYELLLKERTGRIYKLISWEDGLLDGWSARTGYTSLAFNYQ